ncbi:general substrate transporter [Calocera cornea HHB12733]|uniref:General substrate transporter n=1 Tax=Calocera cornea HHB12733 TaxID=1353952 RepID=A0A165E025_9BASI|nr:general substrate transporter [Calocera cornea HHB12733]
MATLDTHLPTPTEIFEDEHKEAVGEDEFHRRIIAKEGAVVAGGNLDYARLQAEYKWNPLSLNAIRLYGCLVMPYCCSMANGFDGSIMSTINTMSQYLNYFGLKEVGASTSLVFSIYNVGNMVGAPFSGIATEKLGRRGGMFLYAFFVWIGIGLIVGAKTHAMFIGGRFVLGFGIAFATCAAPTYATEITPPTWRGRLAGLYNTFYQVGSVIVTGIMVSSTKFPTSWAFRLPLLLQLIPSVIVGVGVFMPFVKESPRWLMAHGREEEAMKIIIDFHADGDPNHPIVELEMREIRASLAEEGNLALPWWDWSCLWKNTEFRWRSLMMVIMSFFGQWSGNGLGYFTPVLYENVGITDQNRRVVLSFIGTFISWFGAVAGAATTDWFGRRGRLIWGTLVLCITLALITLLTGLYGSTGVHNIAGSNTAIAFINLFSVFFAFAYTPLQSLYCAETLHYTQRARGMAMHGFLGNVALFVNTYGIPIALANIGYKTYLVYVGWTALEVVVWYFCAVETRGFTIEELDEIFKSPNPIKASQRRYKLKVSHGHLENFNEKTVSTPPA